MIKESKIWKRATLKTEGSLQMQEELSFFCFLITGLGDAWTRAACCSLVLTCDVSEVRRDELAATGMPRERHEDVGLGGSSVLWRW